MKNHYNKKTENTNVSSVLRTKSWRSWRQWLLLPLILVAFITTNTMYSQEIPTSTTVQADFGVDGDGLPNFLTYWPLALPPDVVAAPGTDDWIGLAPNGNTATGAGVIDINSPFALAEIAKISAGQNVGIELRMSAPIYTVPDANGTWLDAAYIRDQNVAGGNKDMSVFEQSINKNFDDPRAWTFKNGDVPAKTDIIDVYAHLRRDLLPNDYEFAYIAASTADADGSNHLDFEYFRKKIDFDGTKIVYQELGDGEDCGHTSYRFSSITGGVDTHGDVLLSVDYKDGGRTAVITILAWIDKADFPDDAALAAYNLLPARPFDFIIANDAFSACTNEINPDPLKNFGYHKIKLRGDSPIQAIFTQLNNTGTTPAPNWGTINSGGNVITAYEEDTFVEIAINASLLGFDTRSTPGCESGLGSIMVKSRSSHSWTSALKDMGGPFDLGDQPEITVEIDDASACQGDPVVTLTADLGASPPENLNGSPAYLVYLYEWEQETSTPGTWVSVGGNFPTYDVPTTTDGTFKFRVSVTAIRSGEATCKVESESNVVVIYVKPVPTAQDLADCEVGTTGAADFNLADGLVSNDGGTVTYYASQADADNGDPLDALTPANFAVTKAQSPKTIYVRSDNDSDGSEACYGLTSFMIDVYDNPTPIAQDLADCESEQTGSAMFDLNNGVTTADGTITFYASQAEAMAGTPELTGVTTYSVSIADSPKTIWVRSDNENDADEACYGLTSFMIDVYDNPTPIAQDLADCESEQTGSAMFDLNAGVTTADGTITFYASQAEAMAGTPELTGVTTYSVSIADSPKTIWVRSDNENDADEACYGLTSFMIDVYDNPTPIAQDLADCESEQTGSAMFDLNNGVTIPDGTITFYASQAEAMAGTPELTGVTTYSVSIADSPKTIWVRSDNENDADEACYGLTSFMIDVYDNPTPIAQDLADCESEQTGSTMFDLNNGVTTADGTISFYASQAEAMAGTPELTGVTTYSVSIADSPKTIWVRSDNENDADEACYGLTSFMIDVYDNPTPIAQDLADCESEQTGSAMFDLNAGVTIPDGTITFYTSQAEAMAGTPELTGVTTYSVSIADSPKTIWVRSDNENDADEACYGLTSFMIDVYDNPTPIAQDLADCESEQTGSAMFDLNAGVTTADGTITFYASQAEAMAGTPELTGVTTYSVSIADSPKTIWVRSDNENDADEACYGLTSFMIDVYDNPTPIAQDLADCESEQTGSTMFDLNNGVTTADGTITFYASQAEAMAGTPELTGVTTYSVSIADSPKTIWVRSDNENDADEACYGLTSFMIDVYDNPTPIAQDLADCESEQTGSAMFDLNNGVTTADGTITFYASQAEAMAGTPELTGVTTYSVSIADSPKTIWVRSDNENDADEACYGLTSFMIDVYDNPTPIAQDLADCESEQTGSAMFDLNNGVTIPDGTISFYASQAEAMAGTPELTGVTTYSVSIADSPKTIWVRSDNENDADEACYGLTSFMIDVYDNPTPIAQDLADCESEQTGSAMFDLNNGVTTADGTITFYASQAEAMAGTPELTGVTTYSVSIADSPKTIWVRSDNENDADEACYGLTSFMIDVYDNPTPIAQDLADCESEQTGSAMFDLNNGVTIPDGTITFYASQAEAMAGTPELTGVTTYSVSIADSPKTIWVRSDNENDADEACYGLTSFMIDVYDNPTPIAQDLADCESEQTGSAMFDLNAGVTTADGTISFYASQAEAMAGTPELTGVTTYSVSIADSPKTIWVRSDNENDADEACYGLTSFMIDVYDNPTPIAQDLADCESEQTGSAMFDLNAGVTTADGTISFYASQAEAMAGTPELTGVTTYSVSIADSPKTIWVRSDNENDADEACYGLTSFMIDVYDNPTPIAQDLADCESEQTGSAMFDLNNGVTTADGTITFYASQAEAMAGTPELTGVTTYSVSIADSPKTIWVRSDNENDANEACYGLTSFMIDVYDNPTPIAQDLADCESEQTGSAMFDLNAGVTTADGTISFYASQAEAMAGTPELTGVTTYSVSIADSPKTIWVRSDNENDADEACYGLTSFMIDVYDNPTPIAQDLADCESEQTGSAMFDLNAGVTTADGTITFYASQAEAMAGTPELTGVTTYSVSIADSPKTIWVRSDNENDADEACYGLTSFMIDVYDNPTPIAQDLADCESEQTGSAMFDLNAGVTIPDGTITFYASQAEAMAGTPELTGVTTYSVSIADSPKTIWVRSDNENDADEACYGLTSFMIDVYDNPTPIAQDLADCESEQTGSAMFDLNAGVTIPDGTITFYASQAEAMAGTPELTGVTTYSVSIADSPKTIWVRSDNENDADEACYGLTSFMIDVYDNPTPIAQDLADCESEQTGSAMFDLNAGVTTADGTISFYASQAEAMAGTPELTGVTTYSVSIADSPKTIWVRSDNENDANEACYGLTSFNLTVNPNPTCSVRTGGIICFGDILYLFEEGGNATSWSWRTNGLATIDNPTLQNPTVTGAANGEIFTVEITDSKGCKSECEIPAVVEVCDCDTAFAKLEGSTNVTCFKDDGFSRWGWTNYIATEGTYNIPLYAGNSGCSPSDDNLAGLVNLTFSEGIWFVEYVIDEDYVMTSAHVYIGCNPYPTNKKGKDIVSPGQYTYNSGSLDNVSGATIEFSGIEDSFNIIVHAVVCKAGTANDPVDLPNYTFDPILDCDPEISVTSESTLDFKAYPVPFNNVLNIEYKYEYDTDVKIQIFDTKGRLIIDETDTSYRKGEVKTIAINMSKVADQILIVRLITDRDILSKLVVSKSKKRK